MDRMQIDGARIREVLVEAADEGLRIALDGGRSTVARSDPQELIALSHRHLLRKAMACVPVAACEAAEAPLSWSLEEVMEWVVFGSLERAPSAPPLTWSPPEANAWPRAVDDLADSRFDLLREELAEAGITMTATRRSDHHEPR